MNTKTKVFLKKKIKQYYWENPVKPPFDIHKREFGFGTLEDKIRHRHKSFQTSKQLDDYLKLEAPAYISYSTAYYEFPENQPMASKIWEGADIVFDLDIDISFLNSKTMEKMRDEAQAVYDFLIDDFGFSKKDIIVNFSGSKGYHIHILNEDIRYFSQNERRSMIDYITGSGLDLDAFMKNMDSYEGISFNRGRQKIINTTRIGPNPSSLGWGKRIYDVTKKYLSSDKKELMELDGVGSKTAEKLLSDRDKNLGLLKEGRWDALIDLSEVLKQKIISEKAVIIKDADKQVTLDTSRLIRLPETIHGGSGMKAGIVNKLDDFDPLVECVIFSEETINIKFIKDIPKFEIMENKWGPYKKDSNHKVPEYVGIYLMLKNSSEIL